MKPMIKVKINLIYKLKSTFKIAIPFDILVYRGINNSSDYNKGDIFTMNAFISTSYDKQVSLIFSDCLVVV